MTKICYIVTVPQTIRAFFVPQIRYLSNNGYNVSVICSPDSKLKKELGHRIHYYPVPIPRGVSIVGTVKAIIQITKILKKEKFPLVQYSTPNASLCSSIASKLSQIPIRNYHLMGLRYLGEKGVKRVILCTIEKLTCKLSTNIECVSKSNLKLGLNEGLFPKSKATVVWNGSTGGVDIKKFDYGFRDRYRKEIRSKYNITDNILVYGFVGRITRDKGIEELLEAFLYRNREAILLLIGDIEDKTIFKKHNVRKLMACHKIRHIKFVNDIEKYYSAIDVLILPSYREGFGNVIIEAAAIGTPSIISRIPGPIDAVIEDETALVVPVKNSRALSFAMDKMEDLNFRNRMGKKAVEFSRASFDSKELCKIIKKRKDLLLGKD